MLNRDAHTLSDMTSYAFDDGSKVSTDYDRFYASLLFHVLTPRILKELPAFAGHVPEEVLRSLPKDLLAIPQDKNFSRNVYRWHLNKAVFVLRGYADCPVPLTDDPRVKTTKRNLLSEEGKILLKKLTLMQKHPENTHFSNSLKDVFRAGHKLYLDLDLFITPDTSKFLSFSKKTAALLSEGCYNNCVHCGYGPSAPVRHTPFPVFLNTVLALNKEMILENISYLNSDPIFYRDPIIGADMGDAFFMMREFDLPSPAMVTKGILQPYTKIALLKTPYTKVENITFSLVNLAGEPIKKNIKRVKESIRIARTTNMPMHIQYYDTDRPEQKEKSVAGAFGLAPMSVLGVVPLHIGNWHLNNPDAAYIPSSIKFGRNGNSPALMPDGSIKTFDLNRNDCQFHPVTHANIYEKPPVSSVLSFYEFKARSAGIGL